MRDYTSMYGDLYDESLESIENLRKQYSEKLKNILPEFSKYANNKDVLTRNIHIFDKVIKEKQEREIKENFVLKKEHLQLLQHLNFEINDILSINYKRTLGSSCGDYGIKEILKISEADYEENEDKYLTILKELKYAIMYLIKEKLQNSV